MKAKELRNQSNEELEGKRKEFKKELFNLRCQNVLGRMENPSRFKTIRKDIARIETIIKETRLETAAGAKQVGS